MAAWAWSLFGIAVGVFVTLIVEFARKPRLKIEPTRFDRMQIFNPETIDSGPIRPLPYTFAQVSVTYDPGPVTRLLRHVMHPHGVEDCEVVIHIKYEPRVMQWGIPDTIQGLWSGLGDPMEATIHNNPIRRHILADRSAEVRVAVIRKAREEEKMPKEKGKQNVCRAFFWGERSLATRPLFGEEPSMGHSFWTLERDQVFDVTIEVTSLNAPTARKGFKLCFHSDDIDRFELQPANTYVGPLGTCKAAHSSFHLRLRTGQED